MRIKYTISIISLVITVGWASSPLCATYKDFLGREIMLKGSPGRIVSLAPSITEILYFLGLGERVIGVTRFSYYPPEAAKKPKVGSYVNLNVEKIISLSPDLVIGTADGNNRRVVSLLEQAGISVFVVNPRNIRDIIDTIDAVGYVCGVAKRAAPLSQRLKSRVDEIRGKTSRREEPLVLLQINLRPIMTINRTTYLHDLIGLAGGRNMGGDLGTTYPRIGLEEVIKRNPEVIIISSMERGGEFEKARQEWLRWRSIRAARDGRVHLIDSDLIDRPSPRIIDGLEVMARLIHPEVKWE